MKYFWFLPKKKVNFLFIFSFKGKNFFHSHFSLILLSSARLVGIILGETQFAPGKWLIMSF